MDVVRAIDLMRQGKIVARMAWRPGRRLRIFTTATTDEKIEEVYDTMICRYYASPDDVSANDWYVVQP